MCPATPEKSQELLKRAQARGYVVEHKPGSLRVYHPQKLAGDGPVGFDFDTRQHRDDEALSRMLESLLLSEETND